MCKYTIFYLVKQKMKKTLFLFLLFSAASSQAQVTQEYQSWIKKAKGAYDAKEYQKSAETYSTAFISLKNRGLQEDRYDAARAWAKVGNADSTFFQLNRILERMYFANYEELIEEKAFESLHQDARWQPLVAKVKINYEKENNYAERALKKHLDSLKNEDQKWRILMVKTRNGEANEMPLEEVSKKVAFTDSIIYFELKAIVKKYGFPNFDLVGTDGSHSFWLLMQHQDQHPEFQEEVLALMKTEMDNGKASTTNYAYLLDRVRVNTGKQQVYGTQMRLNADGTSYEPNNLEEPTNVNERRKSVGLGTIEEYIETMNKRNYGSLKKKE